MTRILATLRAPFFAFGVVAFLATYCGVAAWLPWSTLGSTTAPTWAVALGLRHPFSSPVFLIACTLLFASTFACTWARLQRIRALLGGERPLRGVALPQRGAANLAAFLRSSGFTEAGAVLVRRRLGLWGGFVMHVGLLVLMVSVALQQAARDVGQFELGDGETLDLSQEKALGARERGPLAAALPPKMTVTLASFDPFLHQPGFAPDRVSGLVVRADGGTPVRATVDRAAGVSVDGVTIYQAIPTGIAVNLEIGGMGVRSIHLYEDSDHTASTELRTPDGTPARFVLTSERVMLDPAGTGALSLTLRTTRGAQAIPVGANFGFGSVPARLISFSRWGRFTYSRSPLTAAVFCAFAIILIGGAAMSLPAAVARVGGVGENAAGWVFATRGADVIAAGWVAWSDQADGGTSSRGGARS